MDMMKTIMSVVLAVVLLMTVAVPVIDSMDNSLNNKASNEGAADSNRHAYAEDWTSELVYDGNGHVTIGGAAVTSEGYILADGLMIHVIPTGIGFIGGSVAQNYISTTAATVTFSDGTWTITATGITGGSETGTYDWIVHPDRAGELYLTSLPAHVDPDAVVYVCGYQPAKGNGFVYGPVDDLEVGVTYASSIASATATYTEGQYNDTLTKVTITKGDTTTVERTDAVIVPVIYTTGPEPDHLVPDLVALIPVLLIAGLIVAVGWTVVRNRD